MGLGPFSTLAYECTSVGNSCCVSSRTAALTARLESAVVEEARIVATLLSSCHLGRQVCPPCGAPQFLQRMVSQESVAACFCRRRCSRSATGRIPGRDRSGRTACTVLGGASLALL